MTSPVLSIVVCTFRRPELLRLLLQALNAQTAQKDVFEVLVIDNAPELDPRVQAVCSPEQYAGLDVRYFHHEVAGTSQARNRGVREARGAWIGFIDDDEVPVPAWVALALQATAETGADGLCGQCPPYYGVTRPAWFKDAYVYVGYGDQSRWLEKNEPAYSGNMLWKREVFEQVGSFATIFGYLGGKKIFGEDTHFALRAYAQGWRVWYEAGLSARHFIPAEQMTVAALLKGKTRRSTARARIWFDLHRHEDQRPFWRIMLSQLWQWLKWFWAWIWAIALTAWRDQRKYPYRENYQVEYLGILQSRTAAAATLLKLYWKTSSTIKSEAV